MVQKYFWLLRKLFPRSRNNSLWREILWKSRNIWKDRFSSVKQFFLMVEKFLVDWELILSIKNFFNHREFFLSMEKFPVDREIFCRWRNFLSIEKLPVNQEFFRQSTNWKACSDIRQKEVISGATSRNGRCFFERINRVSNLPAQVKLLHNFNFKRSVSKTVWGDIPIGCFAIFLSSSVIKILLIGVTPGDHCGRSISKNGKAPHVFLDCYLRSLRTKFEVNP